MYIPGPSAALPPLIWGSCGQTAQGIDCQAIDTGWMDGLVASVGAGQPGPGMDVDAGGNGALLLYRGVPEYYTMLVIASDKGTVHTAVLRAHPGITDQAQTGCRVLGEDINEGQFLVQASGNDASDSNESDDTGPIGGPIDARAPALIHHDTGTVFTPSWRAGEKWLLRSRDSTLTAHPWDMSQEIFVASPATDPDGYKAFQGIVSGDAMFWAAASLHGGGLMVWDPVHGTRPFVRWPGDLTRMARNLGTDGVDMVWSEGEGKQPNETEFPIRRIMAAPFTPDPDALQARRLRSQPNSVGSVWPWVVGCGHAAFEEDALTIVVRLSDGWMWTVPNLQPNTPFHRPIGITCDHVYLRATFGTTPTIARVRIDSLGAGEAPD